jgi:hypothetical protein
MNPAKHLPLVERKAGAALPSRWNHQRWGTLEDPIHKSHMSSLIGEFSCTRQFQFDRLRELRREERETCSGKTAMGTAAHETIARALRNPATRDDIVIGCSSITHAQLRGVLVQEFERETAGKSVVWYGKAEREEALNDVTAMLFGLVHDLYRHVAAIELVEAGLIAQLGDYWIEGHVDLIYRPRENPEGLATTDWKTGAQKPHQLVLDHGFESGFYSAAIERGLFLPTTVVATWRELARRDPATTEVPLDPWDVVALGQALTDREAMHIALRSVARRFTQTQELVAGVVRFGHFPEVIRLTHLADYVPYAKKGTKTITRPEDIEHWSRVLNRPVQPGEKVPYEKGMTRGGAWLTVKRTASDVQRLERLLRTIVGWVRMGKFVESVGEKCTRCSYRGPCLTSGYELDAADAKELNASLRTIEFDFDDVANMNADD